MSAALSVSEPINLARHEGRSLLSAPEALLKGLLEAETGVALVAGPKREPFAGLFDLVADDAVADLLDRHGTRLVAAPDAARAVVLAAQTARSGRSALALVPNDDLDRSMQALNRACGACLESGAAMVVLLEDRPRGHATPCPRLAAQRLGLAAIEPGDVAQLRDSAEQALRLAHAGGCPVAIVVHSCVLRSAETVLLCPNRVMERGQVIANARRRRPGWSEAGGVLRMARRIELNRAVSLPSPGERVQVGFIVVGPAKGALEHLFNELGLGGRVPVLQLGLVRPIDDSAVGRMLSRCEAVIVLEPRPGVVELDVLAVAEVMRQRGESPAAVWGQRIPPDPDGLEHRLEPEEALHPSILGRKIVHLLHEIRPGLGVASQFAPDPPAVTVMPPRRGEGAGAPAALAFVRRLIGSVDQWLRDRAPLEERGIEPTTLALDGVEPAGGTPRVVRVETWDRERFGHEGIAAVRQAARDDQAWIFVVCDTASDDDQDLERLIRGVIPGDRTDRVRIEVARLGDRTALRDLVREASLAEKLTVIIASDSAPARYDATAMDQALADVDRLGFPPRQRLIWPAAQACEIRPVPEESARPPDESGPSPLAPGFSIDRLHKRSKGQLRLTLRPRLEQVEVVRTRPPARHWRGGASGRLPLPEPLHGRRSQWRAHLAGFRGNGPGLAAHALSVAGRVMGYDVRSIHDPTPIGAGRRGWAQVLFTNPRRDESPMAVSTTAPYGQVDLLLGMDPLETLRALGPDAWLRVGSTDHTSAVVNVGAFRAEIDRQTDQAAEAQLLSSLRAVTRADQQLIENFADVCRIWLLTDRVVDLALLGAAFQMGFVPVRLEAIEAGVASVEERGFHRSMEVFRFGRHLAVDQRLWSRPKGEDEDVRRLLRRLELWLFHGRWAGATDSRRFARLARASLDAMPGLTETDLGRQARRDFVIALYRCLQWGGFDYAETYAELVTGLYEADRGDTGRALTRNAILPLAAAMLIRDLAYVASMATSAEHRRRIRQRLNVRRARGDQLERRYLTCLDVTAFGRRMRLDIRTSDWPARLVAAGRRIIPRRWRGTSRQREMRSFIIDLVRRATRGSTHDYRRWSEALQRLHGQACNGRLETMALSELRMLVESAAEAGDSQAAQAAP